MSNEIIENLFKSHKYFLGYAIKIAGQNGEDAVQDAYLRLVKKNGALVDIDIKSYMFSAVRSAAFDGIRRKKKLVPLGEIEPAAKEQESSEISDDVTRAIDSLEPRYKNVIILASKGFMYKEIAEIEKIPIGTVMSRLYRAREQLQEKLKDYNAQSSPQSSPERPE